MEKDKRKGFFVVIEGGDGCGKSTLINNLKNEFKNAVFTREPGGTEYGEKIREVLFSCEGISKLTEMLIFASTRSELIDKVIAPNLNQGKLIICDRFVYSSYVYQGICTNVGLDATVQVNNLAIKDIEPDLVIFLKAEKSFRDGIENRFDIQTKTEREMISIAYDKVAEMEKNAYVLKVDGKSIDDVFNEAKRVILERYSERQKYRRDYCK